MRTTLDIAPSVLEAARTLAASTHRSIGAVISDLAMQGLRSRQVSSVSGAAGLPTFAVPSDASLLDPRQIRRLIESDGLPD